MAAEIDAADGDVCMEMPEDDSRANDFNELPQVPLEDERDKDVYCCLCSLPQFRKELLKPSKSKKRKRSNKKDVGENDEQRPSRVNYFLATQVANPQIKCRIEQVQDAIISQQSKLRHAKVSTSTLHLTLAVMHLSAEQDFSRVRSAMDSCQEKLKDCKEWPSLEFHGLGHFRNQVLFVKVREGEALQKLQHLADLARHSLRDVGLLFEDGFEFKPHLTIMKLSKAPQLRRQGIRKIDASHYVDFENYSFGEEPIRSLQLLSMDMEKDDNGYYHCDYEVQLGQNDT